MPPGASRVDKAPLYMCKPSSAVHLQVKVFAQPDQELLMAATASRTVEKEGVTQGPFKPVHGYSTDDVLRDRRFEVCHSHQTRALKGWSGRMHACVSSTLSSALLPLRTQQHQILLFRSDIVVFPRTSSVRALVQCKWQEAGMCHAHSCR